MTEQTPPNTAVKTDLSRMTWVKAAAIILLILALLLGSAAMAGLLIGGGMDMQELSREQFISIYSSIYSGETMELLLLVYDNLSRVIIAAVILPLLALALFVFLMFAAGRREDAPYLRLNTIDRLPLDLYLLVCIVAALLLMGSINYVVRGFDGMILAASLPLAALVLLLGVGFCMSFATRVKLGGWWRNTLIYRLLHAVWTVLKAFARICREIISHMSLVWRTIAATVGLFIINMLCLTSSSGFWILTGFCIDGAVLVLLCNAMIQMERLKVGGEQLAAGRLEHQIDVASLRGELRKHGENLNSIGAGMSIAVEERMKSERMKTELITNVSHDIKTPLTSIINYVDLLQKQPIDDAEAIGYIDVLQRQAARLKKLIEDLVEASKASTGNIGVDMQRLDIRELLNQSLGEYGDRLAENQLELVCTQPEWPLNIMADGRLLWRAFDNLLNNICKYSQPQTRVYCEVTASGGRVKVSFKNISRELLNVSVDELMERFVRGDSARSTEGSGLGLSIARSLIELQQGRFELDIDGDLFKAAISFPLQLEESGAEQE
ncbi:MAG: HAMP domain-containing sensor histidine kinase [Bacillota bacterium]|nr:HAMP domain-containing sensor histidine kinase [Bacillota bacterium]